MAKKTRKARPFTPPPPIGRAYFERGASVANIPPPPLDPPPAALPSAVSFVEAAANEHIQRLHTLRARLENAGLLNHAQSATGGQGVSTSAPAPHLLSTRLEEVGRSLHIASGELFEDINARLQV